MLKHVVTNTQAHITLMNADKIKKEKKDRNNRSFF